jgi:hypothetical protein
MELKELKKGDKLYYLGYWEGDGKRSFETLTVRKVHKNRIFIEGRNWSLGEKEFNRLYFPSKLEMFENALDLHLNQLSIAKQNYEMYKKEVKYLERKVKEWEKRMASSG